MLEIYNRLFTHILSLNFLLILSNIISIASAIDYQNNNIMTPISNLFSLGLFLNEDYLTYFKMFVEKKSLAHPSIDKETKQF